MEGDLDVLQRSMLQVQGLRRQIEALDRKELKLRQEKPGLQQHLEQVQEGRSMAGSSTWRLTTSMPWEADASRKSQVMDEIRALGQQFRLLRRNLHMVEEQLTMENLRIDGIVREESKQVKDEGLLLKLDDIIGENLAKLEEEHGQLSGLIEVTRASCNEMNWKRSNIEDLLKNVKIEANNAEKAVWQRNIMKSYTSGVSKPEVTIRKPEVPATCRGLEEEVAGKQQELESLARSLEQGREILRELRRNHLISVPYQKDLELEVELREVKEGWRKEKEGLQEELEGLRDRNEELRKIVENGDGD